VPAEIAFARLAAGVAAWLLVAVGVSARALTLLTVRRTNDATIG
jgi:microcompartment protein CcmK/EutM